MEWTTHGTARDECSEVDVSLVTSGGTTVVEQVEVDNSNYAESTTFTASASSGLCGETVTATVYCTPILKDTSASITIYVFPTSYIYVPICLAYVNYNPVFINKRIEFPNHWFVRHLRKRRARFMPSLLLRL